MPLMKLRAVVVAAPPNPIVWVEVENWIRNEDDALPPSIP